MAARATTAYFTPSADNCSLAANTNQANNDNDALANVCDPDDDNDEVLDASDVVPFNPNESVDTDADGTGNNADTDDGGDGQSDADELVCGSNPLDATSKCAPTTTGPPTTVEQCKNGGWRMFTVLHSFMFEGMHCRE